MIGVLEIIDVDPNIPAELTVRVTGQTDDSAESETKLPVRIQPMIELHDVRVLVAPDRRREAISHEIQRVADSQVALAARREGGKQNARKAFSKWLHARDVARRARRVNLQIGDLTPEFM